MTAPHGSAVGPQAALEQALRRRTEMMRAAETAPKAASGGAQGVVVHTASGVVVMRAYGVSDASILPEGTHLEAVVDSTP